MTSRSSVRPFRAWSVACGSAALSACSGEPPRSLPSSLPLPVTPAPPVTSLPATDARIVRALGGVPERITAERVSRETRTECSGVNYDFQPNDLAHDWAQVDTYRGRFYQDVRFWDVVCVSVPFDETSSRRRLTNLADAVPLASADGAREVRRAYPSRTDIYESGAAFVLPSGIVLTARGPSAVGLRTALTEDAHPPASLPLPPGVSRWVFEAESYAPGASKLLWVTTGPPVSMYEWIFRPLAARHERRPAAASFGAFYSEALSFHAEQAWDDGQNYVSVGHAL